MNSTTNPIGNIKVTLQIMKIYEEGLLLLEDVNRETLEEYLINYEGDGLFTYYREEFSEKHFYYSEVKYVDYYGCEFDSFCCKEFDDYINRHSENELREVVMNFMFRGKGSIGFYCDVIVKRQKVIIINSGWCSDYVKICDGVVWCKRHIAELLQKEDSHDKVA